MVKNIVGKNLNLPILNSVLLTAEDNQINLLTTNLELGINYFLTANVEQKGKLAVPTKIFSDFIANIKDGQIDLLLKENTLHIQSVNFKTKIICFDPKDFPLIPKIKDNTIVTLPAKTLKTALNVVFDSVSLSQTRPELSGVFVSFQGDKIFFASTDSFRLTEKVISGKPKKETTLIIPRNTVAELIRILSETDEDVSISAEENQIQFSSGSFEVVSRLVEGRYPDYQKVIPSKSVSQILFKKEDFQNNIRLAGFFASNVNDIGLKVDKKEVTVFSKSPDRGEFSSKIKNMPETAKHQIEEPFEVLLNYNYLADGLKNIPTEEVVFEYTGEGAPIIIRPKDPELNYTYLIMPLKT